MIGSLQSAVEALLFAAGSDGLKTSVISDVLQITESEAASLCHGLRDDYTARLAGIELVQNDGVWQMVTRAEYGPFLTRLANGPASSRLSQAALEVLAIVAYRQPLSRGQIEAIRGVQSDGVVTSLVHRQLIEEVGRLDAPGRPILYGTTTLFLQSFGLHTLDDLPPLPEAGGLPLDLNLFELNSTVPRD